MNGEQAWEAGPPVVTVPTPTERETREALRALVYEQDRDGAAGRMWTVDQFLDRVLDLFAAVPVPSPVTEWEYGIRSRRTGNAWAVTRQMFDYEERVRRVKAGPWEVVPDTDPDDEAVPVYTMSRGRVADAISARIAEVLESADSRAASPVTGTREAALQAERDALQRKLDSVREERNRLIQREASQPTERTDEEDDERRELYPEVEAFAKQMRAELWANRHKGDHAGWRSMTLRQAWGEISWHVAKMAGAMKAEDVALLRELAADVANGAMMFDDILLVSGVADVCRCGVKVREPSPGCAWHEQRALAAADRVREGNR